jgi:hypothetical protein
MSLRAYFARQPALSRKLLISIKLLFNARRLLRRGDASTAKQKNAVFPLRARPPRHNIVFFLLSSFFLFSCQSDNPPVTPQLVTVYSTSAAQPWLSPLYECAGVSTVISRVDDPAAADVVLRVGEPTFLDSPAYQIDQEEIWIITHRESSIPSMNLEEVQTLFAGQGDPSIQVWVYTSEQDIQQVFDQYVMKGRNVASSANVAASPQQMLNVLESERQAIGILPLTWSMKMTGSGGVYHVATVPVLAITDSEPQGVIQEVLACLQK